jgi:predicted permease
MSWTQFFRRAYWDDERARELDAYLQQETDDNIARGMSPEMARRAAHRKLGNVTRIREEIYEMNTIGFLETVWQDLRYGARILRRNPTFAIVAILTLALGTGANAAIFQLVDAVRLRTLPVKDPHQLYELQIDAKGKGRTGSFRGRRPMFTFALWQQLREQQQGFSSLLAWSPTTFDLAAGGEVRRAQGLWVSGSFFDTLGVRPALGRLIVEGDDSAGCTAPGVVLSHGFWRREYGGRQSAIGDTILLDGHRFDIIGVTPEEFFGVDVGRTFDVALPICSEPIFGEAQSFLKDPATWFLSVIGRVKPDWSTARAETQLRAVFPAILERTLPPRYVPEDSEAYLNFSIDLASASTGISSLRRAYATPLWILLGVTGVVLLIACANLANLMLARATARSQEIGVRLAIGASRRRIVRQMLSESLLLAAVGAAFGLLLSRWLSAFLVAFLSNDVNPLFVDLAVDWRIFAFVSIVAALACLLFGLAPALRATGASAAGLGARLTTDTRERLFVRRALVVVQVALSLVLLVGALLFGWSLRNLLTLDPGFREDGVVIVNLDLRRSGPAPEARRAFFNSVVARLKTVPGVDHAAEAAIAPMSGSSWNNRIVIDGKLQQDIVNFNSIGAEYFATLGTPFSVGRDFTPHDTPESPRVAIVNELFVKKFFGNASPIGRVFHVQEAPGGTPEPRYQIVGVVKNTKYTDLREDLLPIAYTAATQEGKPDPFLQVIAHSTIGEAAIVPGIIQSIREINPVIPVQFRSMESFVTSSLTSERLMAALSGFFGGLAVLIAVIGLYGVMSYMVTRRRAEIGIRMALGADRGAVIRMVVGDAGRLLIIGLVAGVALAIFGARSAAALLYGLAPWDPVTLALAAATLGAVALLACWVPAYRASRVSPTTALRVE